MPAGAPAARSSFVGRVREQAELRRLVTGERLVTVVGPGGCGKTRLVAETVGTEPGPLLAFVELAASAGAVDERVLAACSVRDDPGQSSRERLLDVLADSAGLLVLDNCEHVRDDAARVTADLLRSCPGVRVLATSRVGLGLTGEVVLPLVGLDPDGDGAALLLDRARRVQPGLPGGRATEMAAREICRLVDGLPLAVELAAAHARSMPLPAILAGMGDRLGLLVGRDPTALPQHRSVAASIGWSVDLVGAAERRALAALSLVDGRFSLQAALAATGGDRAALENLVDVSLVQHDPQDGRYLLLETVRDYATRRLPEDGQVAAGARLLAWSADLAAGARDGLEHGDTTLVEQIAADEAAIRSAVHWAVGTGQGLQAAAAVVADLAFAWSLRGRCSSGRALAEQVCAVLDPPPALAWARAFLAVYSGDLLGGMALAEDAVARAAATGDDRAHGRALILMGMPVALADPAGAEPVLAAAVDRAERAGDDWGTVEALQVVAYARLYLSDHGGAVAFADRALPALARLGHPQLRAWDAAIRADAAVGRGRYAEAVARGAEGRDLAMAVGEPVAAFGAVLPLLQALVATGRLEEATSELAAFRPFHASHPGLGTEQSMALADAVLAAAGPPDAAAAAAEAALGAAEAIPIFQARVAVLLSTARLRAGDTTGAVEAAEAALAAADATGDAGPRCAARLIRAAAGRTLERTLTEDAHAALATAAELDLLPVVADAFEVVAGLALDAGRPRAAARLQGSADRLRAQWGAVPSPLAALLRQADGPAVVSALGETAAAEARAEGGALDLAAAVAFAQRTRGRRGRPTSGWESLTPTERQVVALVAEGLTNQRIGERLFMTAGTVRTHLRSIFAKLGVANRAELAAAWTRHG